MNYRPLIAGFAIFSMFFGAGNIVLPLYLVQMWPGNISISFVGFCLTGVLVPLLGLIAAVLTGRVNAYFAPLGAFFAIVIQIVLICIEGPFGVIPRSLIVSNGAFVQEFPYISNEIFYAISCIFLYFLAVKERSMVSVIGKFFTPLMLIFLIVLYFFTGDYPAFEASPQHISDAFWDGVYKGYLTYDLPAAIYFTSIAMSYFRSFEKEGSEQNLVRDGLIAGGVAILLLVLVYAAFIHIGMANYHLIKNISPEQILPAIVRGSLGQSVSLIFVFFVLLACLTTAVAAVSVWSEFLEKIIFKNRKVSRKIILIISLIISFLVAELQFKGLMELLQPILQIVYPILIVLTLYNIYKHYRTSQSIEKSYASTL